MNKFIISSIVLLIIAFSACSQLTSPKDAVKPTATITKFNQGMDYGKTQMFSDTLDALTLHSEVHDFNTLEMIQIRPSSDSTIVIKNFTPRILTDITIIAQIVELGLEFHLVKLDTVLPHAHFEITNPISLGIENFQGLEGEVISLEGFNYIPMGSIEFRVLADTEFLQKLATIQVDWDVSFNDYTFGKEKVEPSGVFWHPIRPAQARLYTLLLLNTSYMFSQSDYQERFLNEKFYKDTDLDTRTVKDEDWFTPEETETLLFDNVYHHRFKVGITGGGGLGGGAVLGISNGTLTKQFVYAYNDSLIDLDYLPQAYNKGPHPLYSHEMGHAFGYGHNSNVCSTGRLGPSGTPEWEMMFGFPAVSNIMHGKYMEYELYPLPQEDYYRPEDFDFQQPSWDAEY